MAGMVMAVVDWRHAAMEHGSEVEWVHLGAILVRTSQCNLGAISVVQRDLGRGGGGRGGTIWASLGLAGRLELGVEQCVELRLVCGLELK